MRLRVDLCVCDVFWGDDRLFARLSPQTFSSTI
jgi:hypothetical protein